jgi:hypothetical protein
MTENQLQTFIERVKFESFLKGTKIEVICLGNDVYVYEDEKRILTTEIM